MRNYLTVNELDRLFYAKIEDKTLSILRYIYYFCCCYGLSLEEASTLTAENIYYADGESYLKFKRDGAKNHVLLPLVEVSVAIIKLFEHNEFCQITKRLFPIADAKILNQEAKRFRNYVGSDDNLNITRSTPIKTFQRFCFKY